MAVPPSVETPKNLAQRVRQLEIFQGGFMDAATTNNLSTVLELVFFFGLFANWIIHSLWMIWFDKQGSRVTNRSIR